MRWKAWIRLLVGFMVLTAIWSGLGLLIKANPHWLDAAVLEWLIARRTEPITTWARVITYLGSAWVLVPVTVAAVLLAEAKGARSWGMFVLTCAAGTLVLVQAVKLVVGRSRPALGGLVEVHSSDFPSGHAAHAAAVYLALAWVGLRSGRPALRLLTSAAALILISAVGWSRLYLGVHYLSDVLAGYALGLAWLAVTATALKADFRFSRGHRHHPGSRSG